MVTSKDQGERITPFWNRLPQFFVYPFRPPALYVLLAVAIGGSILGRGGLFGFLLMLVAFLVVMKYAYEILSNTAEGRLQPPRLGDDSLQSGYAIPFKQAGLYLVIGLVTALLGSSLGSPASLAFMLFASAMLPASIMTLAYTESLLSAINPALLVQMVARIGWAYAALWGMLFLLQGGSFKVVGMAVGVLPDALILPLYLFSQFYFTFLMFNLMGYVLYQYHAELDIRPASLIESEQADGLGVDMALFDQFMAEEKYAAAAEELKSLIERFPEEALELRLKLHRLYRLSGDARGMTVNARTLIEALLDRQAAREAAGVYADCAALDPDFRPRRAEDYAPIARMLQQRGEGRLAIRLVNGFHKRFPGHDATPELYILAAQIFVDELQQGEKARPILDFIARQFPDHPDTGRARALLAALSA